MNWDMTEFCVIQMRQSELNMDEVNRFRQYVEAIVDGGKNRIIIDLSGLHNVSSIGIGSLIMISNKIKKTGGSLKLIGVCDEIARVLKRTKFDMIAPVYILLQ
ncbi:MAG: STAS domain-containing protein [SAR324 cluster bacterium]|nr:STAS domain-containing protein [SAR324 cluster bacterium]